VILKCSYHFHQKSCDHLRPATIEGRLYLREEFDAHIKVPSRLGRTCRTIADSMFKPLFLDPEVLKYFPEFRDKYGVNQFKDGRVYALKTSGCPQSQLESPLFEVYQSPLDGLLIVPIDIRAELLITESSLGEINHKKPLPR
jgi:hypothetical protein